MPQVRAERSAVVTVNGMPRAVREGEAFDTDDPVVAEFRWLFESPVEQATAAPGEKRQTRRRS